MRSDSFQRSGRSRFADIATEARMITTTITAQEYETLARQFTDVQVTETDGLLITRAFEPQHGYVLALQPFAAAIVTLIWEGETMPGTLCERGRSSPLRRFWAMRGIGG